MVWFGIAAALSFCALGALAWRLGFHMLSELRSSRLADARADETAQDTLALRLGEARAALAIAERDLRRALTEARESTQQIREMAATIESDGARIAALELELQAAIQELNVSRRENARLRRHARWQLDDPLPRPAGAFSRRA